MRTRLSLAACLALLVPALAGGQSVRGQVIDRGTSSPIAGVVVLLLDAKGATVARALTNESGEYRLASASEGTYRLRTLRIGFRPVTSDPLLLQSGREVAHDLDVASIPISLETVRVTGRNDCQVRPDSAGLTFALWEQVRAALTATQLTAGLRALGATIVSYQQTLDPNRDRVWSQSRTVKSGYTTRPWKSLPPDLLQREGYVIMEDDGSATYFAPDIDILASDLFIEHHCFRVAQRSDSARIGIEFEPTRERRRLADIQGTLWLDRKSSELRRMEFRYVNVPREQETGRSGGDMQFARLKNGAWVITQWNIRMPVLEMRQQVSGGIGTARARAVAVVREVQVSGGELALLTRARDTLWALPPLTLSGTIADSTTGAGVSGARVDVRGTTFTASSDSSGRFSIVGMLPGTYVLDVRTPSLASAGVSYEAPVTFTDAGSPLMIRVPTAEQLLSGRCGSGGILAGTVATEGGASLARDARVVAEWDEIFTTGGQILKRSKWSAAAPDARGSYRICGLPTNAALRVSIEVGNRALTRVDARIPQGARLTTVDLYAGPGALATAAQRGNEAAAAQPQQADAVLQGLVLSDVNGVPVADAEVAIAALTKNTFTDSLGRFRLSAVPSGAHQVALRRMGYKAVDVSVTLAAGETGEHRFLLSRLTTLDTVAVTTNVLLANFERRRRGGIGRFLTRGELARYDDASLARALTQLPGLGMVTGNGGASAWVGSWRRPAVDLPRPTTASRPQGDPTLWCPGPARRAAGMVCACYAYVYIDGMLVNRGQPAEPFDVSTIATETVEAIEYYSGPSQTPVEFNALNATCGVLVIHTRRSSRTRADSVAAKPAKPPA